MYDHKNKVKCNGVFTVEILQINPPGIDIKATETLWVSPLDPTLNDEYDYPALRTLYKLEFVKKLANGGIQAFNMI